MEILKNKKSNKKNKDGAGRQTMFRVTFRNQINLIRIADTKANMILGINTMIISVILGIIGSRLIFDSAEISGDIRLTIPIVIIMITCLASATYAIQATRPRLLRPSKRAISLADKKTSLLFFENVFGLSQEEYLNRMTEIIESKADVYESMIIDLYNQSVVLHLKYKLLRVSYFVFLIGFNSSIVTFLIFWLMLK